MYKGPIFASKIEEQIGRELTFVKIPGRNGNQPKVYAIETVEIDTDTGITEGLPPYYSATELSLNGGVDIVLRPVTDRFEEIRLEKWLTTDYYDYYNKLHKSTRLILNNPDRKAEIKKEKVIEMLST